MIMTKLICPECRHENEAERIYCHNCGARLDRTGLAAKEAAIEDPKKTHQRLRKMFDPSRGKLRRNFFFICKLVLGACVLAAVFEMILAPDVPPARKSIGLPAEINFDIEKAELSHAAVQLRYTQDQVNAYLEYALKNKHSLDKPLLKFDRAIVGFGEGSCTITVERSVFGYPVYTRAFYQVAVSNGKIGASNNGGSIGRLQVHPQIMQYADLIFGDLWQALDRERKLVAKMSGIEFHNGNVTLAVSPPSG